MELLALADVSENADDANIKQKVAFSRHRNYKKKKRKLAHFKLSELYFITNELVENLGYTSCFHSSSVQPIQPSQ